MREQLADYAHEAWSGWMNYIFSKSIKQGNGCFLIPQWAVERWTKQMNTKYKDLPEDHKISDLEEADKMISIFEK